MRTLVVIVLLGVVCEGTNPNLIDLLKRYSGNNPKPVSRMVPTEPSYTAPGYNTLPPPTWVDEEFPDLEEAFLFPGSHYLVRLIEQYMDNTMEERMEVEDIRDYFELPECDLKKVMGDVSKVFEALDSDPEGVALLITRMLIRPILMERMKCPAAILDMTMTKSLMYMRNDFMQKEGESLYTFFRDIAPVVDPMFQNYADDLAERAVREFHGYVFNDTIEYILGFGLKDLAFASHRLFAELVDFVHYVKMYEPYDREMELKHRMQNALWDVRCPDTYEVMENHRRSIWRFREVFGMVETEHICPLVIDFLYKYVNMTMPGHIPNFESNPNLNTVCETLETVIGDILGGYTEYENVLYSMNISSLEEMLKEVLTPEEWKLLEEAVRRLGFMEMNL